MSSDYFDEGKLSRMLLLALTSASGALTSSSWRLRLNIGREPGSAMPAEWAASGARLSLTIDVRFDEADAGAGMEERLLGPAKGTQVMSVLSRTASFVGSQGLVEVPMTEASAWRATTTPGTEQL
eukprot:329141-Prymnesium_polylepis.1